MTSSVRHTTPTNSTDAPARAAGASSAPILSCMSLSKSYDNGHVLAVRDVSLEIHEGEFLAIMGSSGSGKSTLLHLLSTLESPDAGEIHFEGLPSTKIPRLDRFRASNIGFVFQMHFLLPHLSLLDNVILPLQGVHPRIAPSDQRERAVHALESVGLGHRVKHRPSEVSGGERQRAAIARAIINRPHIVFADEPTGNVDSVTEAGILDLFQTIQREKGTTFVVVTHDAEVARRADRVVQMRDGVLLTGADASHASSTLGKHSLPLAPEAGS